MLRVVPLPHRLRGTLEAESGLNDAPTVVLVSLVSTGAVADPTIAQPQAMASSKDQDRTKG